MCRYNILDNRIRLYMPGAYISIVNKALIDILCIYVSRTLIRYVPRTYVLSVFCVLRTYLIVAFLIDYL